MRYYIGLSLASTSGMDSGLAIFDENRTLIMVDKLYKMNALSQSSIFSIIIHQPEIPKSAYPLRGIEQCSTANGGYCQNHTRWYQQIRLCQIRTTGRKDLPQEAATTLNHSRNAGQM